MTKRKLTDEEKQAWKHYAEGVTPLDEYEKGPPLLDPEPAPRKSKSPKPPKEPEPTARIDLHGMTMDQAHQNLINFIANSQSQVHRCVLVITGKGSSATKHWWEKSGILKEQVPRWLEEPAIRPRINSYTQAMPKHGGGGALYVFIRKIR